MQQERLGAPSRKFLLSMHHWHPSCWERPQNKNFSFKTGGRASVCLLNDFPLGRPHGLADAPSPVQSLLLV